MLFFVFHQAIAPMLILLRIALGVAFKHETQPTNAGPVFFLKFGARTSSSDKNEDVPLRPLAVSTNF